MDAFLVDSGALLAMVDANDQHHVAAAGFMKTNAAATFYIPDTIFAETMVLCKARLGAKAAIDLGNRIMSSDRFQIIFLTPADRTTTWDIFSKFVDKEWSYVDCSVLALARRLRVDSVFAFDHHYDQMTELLRVPG